MLQERHRCAFVASSADALDAGCRAGWTPLPEGGPRRAQLEAYRGHADACRLHCADDEFFGRPAAVEVAVNTLKLGGHIVDLEDDEEQKPVDLQIVIMDPRTAGVAGLAAVSETLVAMPPLDPFVMPVPMPSSSSGMKLMLPSRAPLRPPRLQLFVRPLPTFSASVASPRCKAILAVKAFARVPQLAVAKAKPKPEPKPTRVLRAPQQYVTPVTAPLQTRARPQVAAAPKPSGVGRAGWRIRTRR